MENQTQKKGRFEASIPMEERGMQTTTAPKEQPFLPEVKVPCTHLPSGGKPYPKDAWITHRPYMFGEVKQISASKLDNENSYEYILSGVECSFDKYKLTVPDVLYIGLLRKISTLGSTEIVARYGCNKCGKPGQFIFKTTDLEFDDLKAPKLPICVDMSFGEVQFSPMTVEDYLRMVKLDKGENEIALYAAQAKNLDFETAYNHFFNAQPGDSELLLEVDSLLYHSLKPFIKKCSNQLADGKEICGNPIKVELDGGQALLMPFRRNEGATKNKIRFGVESER